MEDSFSCHQSLWGVVTKMASKPFSPWLSLSRSCCFSLSVTYSHHASKLASIPFCHTFIICYPLSVSASDTHTFLFLSYSFSDSFPQAQDHVGSYVHEDKGVCCIPNCSQQPPRTNKAYLLLWPSLESKWIDGYILPGRIFFLSLSPVWRAVEPQIILCDLLPVKNEDVRGRRVQGQLRTQTAGRGEDRKHSCKKQKLNE